VDYYKGQKIRINPKLLKRWKRSDLSMYEYIMRMGDLHIKSTKVWPDDSVSVVIKGSFSHYDTLSYGLGLDGCILSAPDIDPPFLPIVTKPPVPMEIPEGGE